MLLDNEAGNACLSLLVNKFGYKHGAERHVEPKLYLNYNVSWLPLSVRMTGAFLEKPPSVTLSVQKALKRARNMHKYRVIVQFGVTFWA